MNAHIDPTQASSAAGPLPMLVVIEGQLLARSCIQKILKAELPGLEILELETVDTLHLATGRDVRLIAWNINDADLFSPVVKDSIVDSVKRFPNTPVALLSNRDDEATVAAAMELGIGGFFPTSIPVQVAIAGLHLVLAGGVYRPLGFTRPELVNGTKQINGSASRPNGIVSGQVATYPDSPNRLDLTPREVDVLKALNLGLSNKLIAHKLNLSENTVKMHITHIIKKCSARNRTEAVLVWNGISPHHPPSRLRANPSPSSPQAESLKSW